MIVDDLSAVFSTAKDTEAPPLGRRQFFRLAVRTWPFIRPLLKHVVTVLLLGGLSGIFLWALTVFATDLFLNKVLVGEKLQPMQATLLDLDEEYVGIGEAAQADAADADGASADDSSDEEAQDLMTVEQRKIVRNRLIVWIGIGALVVLAGVAALPYYGTWVRHQINQNLRVAMLERAERLSLKYHNQARVGDAVFRIYQDSAMIINLIEQALIGPLMTVYAILAGLVVITFFSPHIALACIAGAVPMVWLTVRYTPRIRRRVRINRARSSDLTSRLQEAFTALKVVKANSAERRILDRFDADSHRALDAAFYLRLEMVILSALVMAIGGAVIVGTEFVLASWVIEKRETYLGALAAAYIGYTIWNLGAFTTARENIGETTFAGFGLVRVWCMVQDLFIGLERAFFLLDLEPEVEDSAAPLAMPSPIERVVCHDVHFSYRDDAPVLAGVDLAAEAGSVTAIVGATGSGKSTLMSLLLRLYDPDSGQVSFNDTDIRDLRVEDIRANTAIALQKNVLFAATVADNIRYAASGATLAEVEAAARVACADEFINAMAKGYQTELGERGGKLSTGQRQRLSIARAIVRDTPILILDEPTASLDARTESRLLANIAEWGRNKVVFLITHRLSTIRNADQIAFLADGRIVETGNHEQLMARPNGRYREFVAAETTATEAA